MSDAAHPAPGGQDHPPHLAHHFDSPEQQFEAGKLGMWLFLAQEILFFGGLFAAYAYFRAHEPEMFLYAHKVLSWKLGGFNTIVLICSSLTMALGVRMAQLGKRRGLIWMLILTLLFAATFLGVKYVEYKEKFEHQLLWGTHYNPELHVLEEHGIPEDVARASLPGPAPGSAAGENAAAAAAAGSTAAGEGSQAAPKPSPAMRAQAGPGNAGGSGAQAEAGPLAIAPATPAGSAAPAPEELERRPENLHIFFGIYFALTGLHGLHVVIGMIVIGWILRRAVRGDFGPDYFTPVDLVGLYWHLVDLIWIFLFPLLYLIG